MKKVLWIVMLASLYSSAVAKDWKESISDGFSSAVDYSKDAYTSVKDSITGESTPPKFIDVTTAEAFTKNLVLTITKVTPLDHQRYEVSIGLKNLADKPVRLMDLYDDREVMLLDDDGFAYPLAENQVYGQKEEFILVPHNAGIRAQWIFRNVEAEPVQVRIFGKDYPLIAQ